MHILGVPGVYIGCVPSVYVGVRGEKNEIDVLLLFFFQIIFLSWRLITLQCCSGFCHTLT